MSANNYANSEQLIDILQAQQVPVLGAGGGFAPIGTVNAYMGTTAPQGWLICNGQTVNIANYPELATHFASHFGSANFFGGDGTTTIAVPDLRGEFLRGSGTNSHTNQGSGANVGVHQDGTTIPYAFATDEVSPIGLPKEENLSNYDALSEKVKSRRFATSNGSDNDARTYTSRPTNTSVTYIIKATVSGNPEGHVYSTDEQIVGTWIDGKLLYEKSFTFNNVTISSTQSNIGDISGIPIENGWVESVYGNEEDEYLYGVGYITAWLRLTNHNFGVKTFSGQTSTLKSLVITIRYTKTS